MGSGSTALGCAATRHNWLPTAVMRWGEHPSMTRLFLKGCQCCCPTLSLLQFASLLRIKPNLHI